MQRMTSKIKKLERQFDQLKSSYKLLKENHERTVKELRDAETYIGVLEMENQILQEEVHRLESLPE